MWRRASDREVIPASSSSCLVIVVHLFVVFSAYLTHSRCSEIMRGPTASARRAKGSGTYECFDFMLRIHVSFLSSLLSLHPLLRGRRSSLTVWLSGRGFLGGCLPAALALCCLIDSLGQHVSLVKDFLDIRSSRADHPNGLLGIPGSRALPTAYHTRRGHSQGYPADVQAHC